MARHLHSSERRRIDRFRFERGGAFITLMGSLVVLALAPLFMPDSSSAVCHSISESAAQGVEDAWVARLGFLIFGFGVIWIVRLGPSHWEPASRLFFLAFGTLMCAAAAFSHRPWVTDAPYDSTEDLLHSVVATGMGFAFAFGVAGIIFRDGFSERPRSFDLIAVGANVILPLGTMAFPNQGGLLQRLLFLIAYAWFAMELTRLESGHARMPSPRNEESQFKDLEAR